MGASAMGVEIVETFLAGLEGPAWGPDGYLYFTDVRGNRLWRRSERNGLELFRDGSGRAFGLAFDLSGALLVCESGEHGPGGGRRLSRIDIGSNQLSIVTDSFEGHRYNGPNDVCVDSRGRIYFTDPRYGDRSDLELDVEGVYRVDPDGAVKRILGQAELQRPNGLAVSPDDRTLYVVDTNYDRGGNRMIWAFDLDDDGMPSGQRPIFDFAPGRGGDGMEVDVEGTLYVCAGIARPSFPGETALFEPGVYLIAPDGVASGLIPIPEDRVSNCCFAGDDLRTLVVTSGRTLFSARVDVPGYHAFPSAVRRSGAAESTKEGALA